MVQFLNQPSDVSALSGRMSVQESSLVSALATTGAFAGAGPTGPHLPGALMAAGFQIVKEAYYGMLDAGVVEKLRGSDASTKASMVFEIEDGAAGAAVGAAGAAIEPAVHGG